MWWWNLCNSWPQLFGDKELSLKKITKYKNNQTFNMVFTHFITIALNRYKFEGLPDTMSERVIKTSLLFNSTVYPFQYMGSYLALPGNSNGRYNMYGDISGAFVYGYNGFNKEINLIMPGSENDNALKQTNFMGNEAKEGIGVQVRENDQFYPFVNVCIYYALQVMDSLRTLEVARTRLKKPYLIICEESLVSSAKNYLKEVKDNEEAIVSTGVFPSEKFHIEELPGINGEVINSMVGLVQWYEDKFKTLCGLRANEAIDKKGENLIADEVNINEEYTTRNLLDCVDKINQGFELFNKNFGTNIKCVPNEQEKEENDNDDIQGISNEEPKSI